jgi:hypothetical protein
MVAAAALTACSSAKVTFETVATAPAVDIKRIAVAPFTTHTAREASGTAMQTVLTAALGAQAGLEVMMLTPEQIDVTTLDRSLAAQAAVDLGVDALLLGTLFSFGYVEGEGAAADPSIRLDLRLVSAKTGEIAWAAQVSAADETSLPSPSTTLTTLADEIARRLVSDLSEHRR